MKCLYTWILKYNWLCIISQSILDKGNKKLRSEQHFNNCCKQVFTMITCYVMSQTGFWFITFIYRHTCLALYYHITSAAIVLPTFAAFLQQFRMKQTNSFKTHKCCFVMLPLIWRSIYFSWVTIVFKIDDLIEVL